MTACGRFEGRAARGAKRIVRRSGRRAVGIATILFCAMSIGWAGESAKPVVLKGWIVDEWCKAGNASAKGADCIRHCRDKGAALVLYDGKKIYRIAPQEMAAEHIGYEVEVSGSLEDGMVSIEKIRPVKKNPAARTASNAGNR